MGVDGQPGEFSLRSLFWPAVIEGWSQALSRSAATNGEGARKQMPRIRVLMSLPRPTLVNIRAFVSGAKKEDEST